MTSEVSKKKEIFIPVIFSILLLFCTYSSVFCYIAFLLGIILIVFMNEEYILSLFFFIVPMSTIFKTSPSGPSFFTYLELFFIIVHFFRKKGKATGTEGLIMGFALLILLNQLLHGDISIATTIKMIAYLFLLSCATEIDAESSHKRIILMYFSGVLASSLMIRLKVPTFRITEFISVKTDLLSGVFTQRLAGLYGDPNYYSITLMLLLCAIIVLYLKSEINIVKSVILSGIIIYFAVQTLSKSAILMLAFPAFFLIYVLLKKRKYFLAFIGIGLGIVFFIMLKSNRIPFLSLALERFSNNTTDITSGRTAIWSKYLNYFIENPLVVLFGRSVLYNELNGHVPHNTYFDIIYQLGILGGFILIIIIIKCFGNNRLKTSRKKNIINYSLLIVVLIMYFFLSELQYFDPPFHLIISMIVMNLDLNVN